MKILFLSQLIPYPLDAGPKMRSYYVLKQLCLSHQVTLLAFSRDNDRQKNIDHLRSICAEVITIPIKRLRLLDLSALIRSLCNSVPFLIERDFSDKMQEAIDDLFRKNVYDVVHADQLWMAPYAIYARQKAIEAGKSVKIILDEHNAVFQIPERMAGNSQNPIIKAAFKREANLMKAYEIKLVQQFDQVVWVTQEDLEQIVNNVEDTRTKENILKISTIIPICIQFGLTKRSSDDFENTRDILFVGGMHWPPNAEGIRWFVKVIFPKIRNRHPETWLRVVGKKPPREFEFLGGVDAPGYVDEINKYWEQACVFIVPLLSGGGMRVKILDAWVHGIPVVSTTIGAEGIKYLNGENILICDEPQDFANRVNELLSNPSEANRIGYNGRKTVESIYLWSIVYKRWDIVYDLAMHNKN